MFGFINKKELMKVLYKERKRVLTDLQKANDNHRMMPDGILGLQSQEEIFACEKKLEEIQEVIKLTKHL